MFTVVQLSSRNVAGGVCTGCCADVSKIERCTKKDWHKCLYTIAVLVNIRDRNARCLIEVCQHLSTEVIQQLLPVFVYVILIC